MVCWSVTVVTYGKMAKLIDMSFRWAQRTMCYMGFHIPSWEAVLVGEGAAYCKV